MGIISAQLNDNLSMQLEVQGQVTESTKSFLTSKVY